MIFDIKKLIIEIQIQRFNLNEQIQLRYNLNGRLGISNRCDFLKQNI